MGMYKILYVTRQFRSVNPSARGKLTEIDVRTLSLRDSVISAISSNNYHNKAYVEISIRNSKDPKSTLSLRNLKRSQS